MIDATSKAFFHTISRSRPLKRLATRYGMAGRWGFARRFIAGEDVDDVIAAARAVQAGGLAITLDYLGESVSEAREAERATQEYLEVIDRVVAAGIERNISLKLSQLGLDQGQTLCTDLGLPFGQRKVLSTEPLPGAEGYLFDILHIENGARMVAMENATKAAGDMIDDMTLQYNKARQSGIKLELLD